MPELVAKITPDTERHTRFTETQAGALICHDYDQQKYYRCYQSEVDLDIIRRFVSRNLCTSYPDVTVRYFAMNWPELCIFFTGGDGQAATTCWMLRAVKRNYLSACVNSIRFRQSHSVLFQCFTDTHIPIGLIIGHQTEPHIGRIPMFAVEDRVEKNLVCKFNISTICVKRQSSNRQKTIRFAVSKNARNRNSHGELPLLIFTRQF
ncbi:unnamed protein product [Echinostoma caproni]|uniref:LSDAT_euk domain-containing protein n=1 Tax=Echinostoma caproni TaxID=27848 RepID=A0A183A572_9TREM|nr:unnamed protein product [Echinostoma caproni]